MQCPSHGECVDRVFAALCICYAKGGIATVRASSSSSGTVGANIEGGVLGEKCLMESIGIGLRY
jgi:hypothetical protein